MTVETHDLFPPRDPQVVALARSRAARGVARIRAIHEGRVAAASADDAGRPEPTAGPGEAQLHPSVVRMRRVGAQRSVEDAELIAATGEVVDAARAAVIERRGLADVDLGRTQSGSVEQEVRNLAVAELQVAVGLGVTEARTMVTAAMSPTELQAVIDRALRCGEASWPLVRRFFDSTTALSGEQRMLVALALFGADPALAHEDRLDPDGALHGQPWGFARFTAALDAEVTACESTDPDSERQRRAKAYERRRLTLKVHDDGTATLRITGPAATLVAANQRIDRAARTLRRQGDERNLDQLRVDTAEALLLYGSISLPDDAPAHVNTPLSEDDWSTDDQAATDWAPDTLLDDTLSPDAMEHIARVVHALPLVQLQVVVPYNALSGGFPLCAGCSSPLHRPAAPVDRSTTQESQEDSAQVRSRGRPGHRGRGLVAEVLGPHPFFITDGHARELALFPGTTLHRLVVDPRDGRLVERTIQAYRPDTDMRRQVIAADVYSRAPGSRLAAHAGELDHVTPYGWAGGPTSETNLALLAKRAHQFKTDGAWHFSINDRRDLTITTVLGQVATTRVHDYRTYLHTRHPDDVDERRDLANRLVYAALAQRPGLREGCGRDGVRLDWKAANGAVYQGASPDHPTLDQLLAASPGPADEASSD